MKSKNKKLVSLALFENIPVEIKADIYIVEGIFARAGYTSLFLRSESEAMGNKCFWNEVVYAYGVEDENYKPKLIIEYSEGE